jgi:hypothetical protein
MHLPTRLTVAVVGCFLMAVSCRAQIFWHNQSPSGIGDDIGGIAYGRGDFAAVTNVVSSAYGLTWSSPSIAPGVSLNSISYGNGLWVVVGANGAIVNSQDLGTWTVANSPTSNRLNSTSMLRGFRKATRPRSLS